MIRRTIAGAPTALLLTLPRDAVALMSLRPGDAPLLSALFDAAESAP